MDNYGNTWLSPMHHRDALRREAREAENHRCGGSGWALEWCGLVRVGGAVRKGNKSPGSRPGDTREDIGEVAWLGWKL